MVGIAPLAALASVAFIYLLGTRTFGSRRLALLAAAFFATTPLLWRQLQVGPSSLYPLPFLTAWLLAMSRVEAGGALAWPIAAGITAGLGVYASPPAAVMMPVYAALGVAIIAWRPRASLRQAASFAAAFAIAAGPLALYFVTHPEVFERVVTTHRLYDAARFNILQGIREMTSWVGLTARSEVYYDYFNPAFLFLTGGVLLLPLALLLPLGLYRLLDDDSPLARLYLGGFLLAPFAGALTAERPTPGRIVFIVPFAAIISTYGAWWLFEKIGGSARRTRTG
jgi:4-amino-4-deoxy-L-arabinose transferase-like glycosyltransferase